MDDALRRTVDLALVRRIADEAVRALGEAREEIDALNVFPVPDGDTGTNMFLTMSAARDALADSDPTDADPTDADPASALRAMARGALLGARGNSGVILSQLVGAFVADLAAGRSGKPGEQVAGALVRAADAGYAAVGTPVEGTILTVARSAGEAAAAAAESGAGVAVVLERAAAAAAQALARTPDQLPTLAAAGVVDAGGRGLCVILDACERVLTGRVAVEAAATRRHIPRPLPTGDLTADGPAYEVMYLLDAEDAEVPQLRTRLAALGDSLVVVGGEGLWHVHVHVDDVGAAVEAGIDAGRPHRIRVTHFADQHAERTERGSREGRAVVSVAAGPGLARVFADAGAVVVEPGPGRRPSVGMLLEAIEQCGAAEVVVLPNDPDSRRSADLAARQAEESGDLAVVVIETEAQVQGLAALAVHEPGRAFEHDVREMTATARHVRHGAVTVAAKRAITTGGPCEPGDVLGAVAGDFVTVGDDLDAVARDIVERLLAGGGELVTLVHGDDDTVAGAAGLAGRVAEAVEERHPGVDVVVYDGGQQRYPLLVAVE